MRNRVALMLAAAVVALVALTGGAGGAGGSAKVKVGDDFFNPERIKVSKGTRVRFRWIDTNNKHNIVKTNGPGGSFASETTDDPGFVFKKRFRKAGRYRIICTIHPDDMVLRLRVRR